MRVILCVRVCVCVTWLLFDSDNGRLQYLRFCLFEMYVNVVFVIRCLYSTVSLTLDREQRFTRIIYNYYYDCVALQILCENLY